MPTLPVGRDLAALERLVADMLRVQKRSAPELVTALVAKYEAALATIVPTLLSDSKRFTWSGGKWAVVEAISQGGIRPKTIDTAIRDRDRRRRKRDRKRLKRESEARTLGQRKDLKPQKESAGREHGSEKIQIPKVKRAKRRTKKRVSTKAPKPQSVRSRPLKPIKGVYVNGTLKLGKTAPLIRVGRRAAGSYINQDVG
jgi:hypothetical protein